MCLCFEYKLEKKIFCKYIYIVILFADRETTKLLLIVNHNIFLSEVRLVYLLFDSFLLEAKYRRQLTEQKN